MKKILWKKYLWLWCILSLLVKTSLHTALPLYKAAGQGDINRVKALLQEGTYVEQEGCFGMTPLVNAVIENHPDVAEILLQFHAKPNRQLSCFDGTTALHIAARKNFSQVASLLLKYGANVNQCDFHGYTPLHNAASQGSHEVTQILIKAGAKVNLQTKHDKFAPLHLAARGGHCQIIKDLLDAAADTYQRDDLWGDSLAYAYKYSHPDIANLIVSHRRKPIAPREIKAFLGAQHNRTGAESSARELPQYLCGQIFEILKQL